MYRNESEWEEVAIEQEQNQTKTKRKKNVVFICCIFERIEAGI